MPEKVPSRTFQGAAVHADQALAKAQCPAADHQSGRVVAGETAPPGILHPAHDAREGRVHLNKIDALARATCEKHLVKRGVAETRQPGGETAYQLRSGPTSVGCVSSSSSTHWRCPPAPAIPLQYAIKHHKIPTAGGLNIH
jgi:hypothetical protein